MRLDLEPTDSIHREHIGGSGHTDVDHHFGISHANKLAVMLMPN